MTKTSSLAMGRPRKVGKQTFAIDEEMVRHVESLKAFRRVFLMLCDHMPAINEGDEVLLRLPRRLLSGEGKVLDVKQIQIKGGRKTAIAVHLGKPEEKDEEAGNPEQPEQPGEAHDENTDYQDHGGGQSG